MSYYDPFYPTLEATRLQIQRSFLALQEKLRLQRQYDLNLDVQNAEKIRRGHHLALAAQEDELQYRQALANSKYLQANIYEREMADRVKYAHQEESSNLRYLSKIQRLQRQRLQLKLADPKVDYYERRSKSNYLSPYHNDQEDQKLLRKYEDGTRARQIKEDYVINKSKYNTVAKDRKQPNEDAQRTPYNNLQYNSDTKYFSNQKLAHLNNLNSEVKRYDYRYRADEQKKHQVEEQRQPRFGEVREDPHENKNLRYNQGNKSARNQRIPGENRQHINAALFPTKNRSNQLDRNYKHVQVKQNNTIQIESNKKKNKDELVGQKNKQLSSRGRSRSQKQLKNSQNNGMGHSLLQSFLEANTDRSDLKSKYSPNKKNPLDKSRHVNDRGAWEKIKKRLKCSYSTYRDSQFHNVKHELNHLFNTYDCENRLRKDLKMKINNHPAVLKKHAMVVQ